MDLAGETSFGDFRALGTMRPGRGSCLAHAAQGGEPWAKALYRTSRKNDAAHG